MEGDTTSMSRLRDTEAAAEQYRLMQAQKLLEQWAEDGVVEAVTSDDGITRYRVVREEADPSQSDERG